MLVRCFVYILLRKQKNVNFCFTLITTFLGSMARLGTVMNTFVHSVMYSYFAIQNFVPSLRRVAPIITCLQLAQFVIACVGMASLISYVLSGHACDTSYRQIPMHFLVYVAFLALFLNFFYHSYVSHDKGIQSKQQKSSKSMRRTRQKSQ